MISRRSFLSVVLPGGLLAENFAALAARPPSADSISELLSKEIDQMHIGPGVVVGLLNGGGPRVLTRGIADTTERIPLNGDTVFGIGR